MARYNLEMAASVLRRLEAEDPVAYERLMRRLQVQRHEIDEWAEAAAGMAIPYDEATGINPQDSHFLDREIWDLKNTPAEKRPLMLHYHPLVIYRFQVLKQADVVLALFLQGDHFSLEQKKADFEYYDPITTGDSTLSGVVQSIIAAEVGYRELALRYFHNALFVDLADLHGNASDGVHVASTGGVWNALVYGFAGMRDYNGLITFDPRLPEAWHSLTFRITLRGTRLRVRLDRDSISFEVEQGGEVSASVRGQAVTVSPDGPVSVRLDGQGPGRNGTIPLPTGAVRRDGAVMTGTVPKAAVPVQR
jgi:alpha,alpha-trehalose phosphorylase